MNKTDISKLLWEAINEHGLDEVTRIMSDTVVGGDKPRFYKGQPVKVANYGQPLIWAKARLSRIENNKFLDKNSCTWGHCRSDHEAPSLINWIEHTGDECPDEVNGKRVLVEYFDKDILACSDGKDLDWEIDGSPRDIARYAIIPEIEWLDVGEK